MRQNHPTARKYRQVPQHQGLSSPRVSGRSLKFRSAKRSRGPMSLSIGGAVKFLSLPCQTLVLKPQLSVMHRHCKRWHFIHSQYSAFESCCASDEGSSCCRTSCTPFESVFRLHTAGVDRSSEHYECMRTSLKSAYGASSLCT